MVTKENQAESPEQARAKREKLMSEEYAADIEEGFAEIERGEYRTIEIEERNKTYRAVE